MIPTWIARWALIGFVVALVIPVPKNKLKALLLLIALGPACWFLFIPAVIFQRLDAKDGIRRTRSLGH